MKLPPPPAFIMPMEVPLQLDTRDGRTVDLLVKPMCLNQIAKAMSLFGPVLDAVQVLRHLHRHDEGGRRRQLHGSGAHGRYMA